MWWEELRPAGRERVTDSGHEQFTEGRAGPCFAPQSGLGLNHEPMRPPSELGAGVREDGLPGRKERLGMESLHEADVIRDGL